ncbi:glutamate 5-kinase [Coriobacterium glomerans PW2]|uniref:Glutamate 5-kinase n=1 Tax=Coriobacterium glomerans (strain ATCC 49209 / DSM 20642 / JCM 10262 / PW2) TaxID=700015 RepID=F2N7G7_CORGP|nr:glutamate 5-kinase [Coriobacterium glomerans]AEB06783.1 glutamate 5-kinase [Coriobacterium glomerans PW2]
MSSYRTMVVKIGSSLLVNPDGGIANAFIRDLALQASHLRGSGWRLVVVSSGAIACGVPVLHLDARPSDMPTLQACASVGQCVLSAIYDKAFSAAGLLSSLVLLTRHDTARRTSYLHARDALVRLVELGVVPVVNENDTVSVEEIRFGDNDTLAALVACLVSADLCVTLSDIDGLYTTNPAIDPTARFIPVVERIDGAIIAGAGDSSSAVGTGGMITKVRASRILMTAGIPSVICSGAEPRALVRLARSERIGTLFEPAAPRTEIAPRKLWIALGDAAHGSVSVDPGAACAIREHGSSLLPVGIVAVRGEFTTGEILDICDDEGLVIARGRAGAPSDELKLAAGRHQDEIASNRLLVALANRPAVHRDEMIVFT